jgi:hypothetical protein
LLVSSSRICSARSSAAPGEHIMSVPPYAVFYRVDGERITVLTIKDGRRVRAPW